MDVYWVRGTNEKRTFAQLSLYRYPLSDALVDVSLRGKGLTLRNGELLTSQDKAPDVGTPGLAPKAWIREGNDFYLLKDGDERDVEAEILASKIISCFKVSYVPYEASMFKGNPVAKCKIITSEARGLISREFIEVYCQNHNKNADDFVIKKDPYSFYMMNILDYLIGNTDRHWGNWGFLVDGETNKILKLYPLMNFNKAFTAYDGIEGANCLTYISGQPMSQKEAAIIAVKAIGLNQIAPIDESFFPNERIKTIFMQRLSLLEKATKLE